MTLLALPVSTVAVYAQLSAIQTTRTINGIEVSGRFLEVWNKQGSERDSVYVNGLPITPRRSEISLDDGRVYEMQWFERARYELHPENPGPNDVLLGRLGLSRVEGLGKIDVSTGEVAHPTDFPFVGVSQPGGLGERKRWFPETRHTLSGKFLEYWNKYGGLSQFGFPLSEPFQEASQAEGKPFEVKYFTVQYFERNRFELHPEKPAPYDVELGLLGVEQYGMRAVPADALPIAPPKNVTTPRDEIRIGMLLEPGDLTFRSITPAAKRIRLLIEDGLVGRDDNDNLFPLDAWYVPTIENGGASYVGSEVDRYLRVKYKLRRGIKWSDGVELTSNDAVFAYKLVMDPDSQVADRAEYEKLQNVDNPDKYTVIYNYRSSRQARTLLNTLPANDKVTYSFLRPFVDQNRPVISRAYSEIGAIYPEHALGKIPISLIGEAPIARAPIGTGPYKVTRWTTGQEMVLTLNEHYTLTSAPLIKRITLKFVVDSNQVTTQVRTGDVDMVAGDYFTVPPADVGLKSAGIVIASRPASTWEHLDFHFDYGPFRERAVREAIFIAINRQRIVDQVYQGAGRVMNAPVPAGVYYSLDNPDFARNYPDIAAQYKLPIYSYDPERAKKLLEDAGWKAGPDGIRAKGGFRLSFEYGIVINSVRQRMQTLVVADLKAVGIDAVPKSYPASSSCWECPDDIWHNGIIKLKGLSSVGTRDSDFSEWLCPPPYDPRGPEDNRTIYCNRAVDDANTTLNNNLGSVVIAAAAQAQVNLMQDLVTVPLVQRPNIELVTSKLVNYKITNSTMSSFWNARQWYFR